MGEFQAERGTRPSLKGLDRCQGRRPLGCPGGSATPGLPLLPSHSEAPLETLTDTLWFSRELGAGVGELARWKAGVGGQCCVF